MAVIRPPRPSDKFAQISNVILQDFTLSSKARGLAVMLLSFPPGWKTTVGTLAKQLKGKGDGYEGVRNTFLELEAKGYLIRRQQRGANGRMSDLDQWIFDDPRDAAAFREQLDAEDAAENRPGPSSENPIAGVSWEDAASPQVRTEIGFSEDGPADVGQPRTTKTDYKKTDPNQTEKKSDGGSSSSSSPSVPGSARTTTTTEKVTPTDALIRAGLPASEHDRYIADLVRKGIANPAGCIIANHRDGELPDAVKRWRVATLVDDAEPDPDPTLCDHGNDVSLGDHMCSACVSEREDPERRRDRLAAIAACDRCDEDGRLYNGSTLCSHEDPTGGVMPDFVRETLRNRPRLPGYGAPDTSTSRGVTPSILENVN